VGLVPFTLFYLNFCIRRHRKSTFIIIIIFSAQGISDTEGEEEKIG